MKKHINSKVIQVLTTDEVTTRLQSKKLIEIVEMYVCAKVKYVGSFIVHIAYA